MSDKVFKKFKVEFWVNTQQPVHDTVVFAVECFGLYDGPIVAITQEKILDEIVLQNPHLKDFRSSINIIDNIPIEVGVVKEDVFLDEPASDDLGFGDDE